MISKSGLSVTALFLLKIALEIGTHQKSENQKTPMRPVPELIRASYVQAQPSLAIENDVVSTGQTNPAEQQKTTSSRLFRGPYSRLATSFLGRKKARFYYSSFPSSLSVFLKSHTLVYKRNPHNTNQSPPELVLSNESWKRGWLRSSHNHFLSRRPSLSSGYVLYSNKYHFPSI